MIETFIDLISEKEDWILKRVVEYAKIHEYTRYTSTLIEAWRISIASLSIAMFSILRSQNSISPPNLDDSFTETALDKFSIDEVHRHRSRGITLGMFLGLVKYYRRSYFDLIREQHFEAEVEREYLTFLENFFDRFEIGYSVEWNALNATQAADELRAQNRTLTNEKNKYLTIFESLYDPVILLDQNNLIENINQAAAELFQEHNLPAHRYYDQHPADQVFPWLAQEIVFFSQSNEQELIVVKTFQTQRGERHFQVKMKRMLDVSEKYRGTVLILNDLTERLKKEEAITLNRAIQKWVNTLIDLSHRISTGVHIDEILLYAMESLYNLLTPEVAVLGMWEEEAEQFRINYRVTANGAEKTEQVYIPMVGKEGAGAETAAFPIHYNGIRQVSTITLRANGQMVGMLWVGRTQSIPFTAAERVVIDSIAQQMSISIEHAQMTAKIQSGAVVEERARLAREMHDGLSQILGFLSLEMQSLELLVKQGKIEATLEELHTARQRIREAQVEVRENILSLRSALARDGEVIPFLCKFIEEFGEQTGIQTRVACDDMPISILLPMSEVQLLRIVQEALNNVRLHARASQLWVSFSRKDGQLWVDIRDDGVGFIEQSLKKHFGLKSMRERTESLHGKFDITSQPGVGTNISLCIPLNDQGVQNQPEFFNAKTTTA